MFYSDKPIDSNENDLFNRSGFAKHLAQALMSLNNTDTFTVGLFGKWGSGKTSIVNLTLQEIRKQQESVEKKTIIIHFEPWNFSSTEQLLSQFFIRLSNEFRKKGDANLEKIGDALEKYSDAFKLIDVFPGLGTILSIFSKQTGKRLKDKTNEKDILKQKEKVIELLERQPNRILIVIDDIDRLDNEKIRSIFQLITSVAKFPNTTYLLAFDKQVVVKALEEVQKGDGEIYLEKIIQIPIQLPEIKKTKLRKLLIDRLDLIFNSYSDISFTESRWQRTFELCVNPFIKNFRDVNRLCNALQFKLSSVHTEVNFIDMVAITSLEIGLPSIYEWIRDSKPILTGENDFSSSFLQKKEAKDWLEEYKKQFCYLLQNGNSNKRVEDEVELAVNAVSRLFPFWGYRIGKSYEAMDYDFYRKNNFIAHPEKFDRYFQLDFDEIEVKKVEIQKAVYILSVSDFSTFLIEQDKKGASYEFLEEVKAAIDDLEPERVKVITKALFKSARLLDVISRKQIISLSATEYAEYMLIKLLSKLPLGERYDFILNELEEADVLSIQTIAVLINRFELGEGRLAANGKKRTEYSDIIKLEELVKLESYFTEKIKTLLKTQNLFNIKEWRMIFYLLENFDRDYLEKYLSEQFKVDDNVLKFLDYFITHWTGDGSSYEVLEKYKLYLPEDRIVAAIDNLVKEKRIFDLSEIITNKCAAFYLYLQSNVRYDEHVAQEEVDKLLKKWE